MLLHKTLFGVHMKCYVGSLSDYTLHSYVSSSMPNRRTPL